MCVCVCKCHGLRLGGKSRTLGSRFSPSPSTVWLPGIKLRPLAWWQASIASEPSGQPKCLLTF